MPTLDLVIDATGMQRGAQQAETALRSVATAAERTGATVQTAGRSMNLAFQATQGGVQIATGIAQTAESFRSLNAAAAGFTGARVLLEIGQTATQLNALRGGAAAASTAFLLLGRAIPYVGLALAAGTAVYSIFGGRVQDTTKKINDQVDALSRLQAKIGETTIRVGYGQADPRISTGGTIDALVALRQSEQESFSARDAAALFGVSEQDLRYALARTSLGEAALELEQNRYSMRPGARGTDFRLWNFSRQQVIGAGEDLLRQRQASMIDPATGGIRGGSYDVPLPAASQGQEITQSMSQAASYAQQIAMTLADGVASVVAGTATVRQAIASIISTLGRQTVSDLGASLVGSLFKPTAAQMGSSPGPGVEVSSGGPA